MPNTTTTTVQIMVKAGSIYENVNNNGIAHFLEHMFFKGWAKYKTPEQVSSAIDEIWWEMNAFTAEEYVWYYIKAAPKYTSKALDVLWDMMINARFPDEELQREKWVIIQEIMMYEDTPHLLAMDKWKGYFYGDNSFGWSILGPVDNIQKFDKNYFQEYKSKLYTKDNSVIIIAGNIQDKDKLLDEISTLFGDMPDTKNQELPHLPDYEPDQQITNYDKQTQQNHLVIWAKGFSIFDQQRYAAKLLWVILWGNMSSRLFMEIREKRGLCYYIMAKHNSSYHDGIFMIRAWLQKDKFDYGLESIYEQVSDIAKWNISEPEYKKALGFVQGKTQMGIETSDQYADFVWEQFLMKWEIKTMEQILAEYQKVQLSDLKTIADKLAQKNLYAYYIC